MSFTVMFSMLLPVFLSNQTEDKNLHLEKRKSLIEETHISKGVRKALAFGCLSVTSATVN